MAQPTLASIPGILARAILRILARALYLAGCLGLLITVTLFLAALFLGTWRASRSDKNQAWANLFLSTVEAVKQTRRER